MSLNYTKIKPLFDWLLDNPPPWLMTSFRSEHHVKTVEQVYALSKEHETCQLFSPESIKKHRKNGHNYIHIGLVQIAVKPLTRKGLNASVLLCLQDARSTNFSDSTCTWNN